MSSLVIAVGCGSVSIFGTRRAGSADTRIIRIAEERGIKELSSDPIRIEIPVEVRAEDESVYLDNGCALRAFIMPAIGGSDFSLDSIYPESVSRERQLRILIPPDQEVIPARSRRIFTIQVVLTESDPEREAIGLLIDESTDALAQARRCVATSFRDATVGVQHFGMQRIPVDPVGPGAAAVAIVLGFMLL